MALSFDDDPSALLYPGSMPAGYQLPVSAFEDAAQEELFRQAMAPQPIMPADPEPYPDPEAIPGDDLAAATTLGPRGTGPGTKTGQLDIGIRPMGDRVVLRPPPPPPLQLATGLAGLPATAAPAPAGATTGDETEQSPYLAPSAPDEPQAAAEPGLEVDAISGGYTKPQAHRILGWTDASGATAASPELPEEWATDDEYMEIVRKEDPKANVRRQLDDDEKKRAEDDRRKTEARREFEDREQREEEGRKRARVESRAKRDRIDAASWELAQTKVDPERWWKSRTTPQTIAAVLGALAGGLVAGRGGKNEATPMIMGMIDRDIDAQKQDLITRRAGIDDDRQNLAQRTAEDEQIFDEMETKRLASYQRARDQIATDMQNWNPRGAKAQKYRDALIGMDAAINAHKEKLEDRDYKRRVEMTRLGIDIDKQNLDREKEANRQREAAAKASAGAKAKELKPADQPRTVKELRERWKIQIPDGVPDDAILSFNDADKLAQAGKGAEQWIEATNKNNPNITDIVDSANQPVQFRDQTFAGKLGETKAQIEASVQLIDELARLIAQNGFESNTIKSREWGLAKGALAQLLLKAKEADHLGVLSGSDIELEMNKLTGGLDPTGMRDATSALLAARDRMLNDLNLQIKNQAKIPPGRKLMRYEPPAMYSLPKADPLIVGRTAAEKGQGARRGKIGNVIGKVWGSESNDELEEMAREGAKVGPTGLDLTSDKNVMDTIAIARSKGGDDAIQRLADGMSSTTRDVSVRTGIANRVRGEDPALYAKVIERLPPKIREQMMAGDAAAAAATEGAKPLGAPQFQFDTYDNAQLAKNMDGDPALREHIIDLMEHGKPSQKAKAREILMLRFKKTEP